MALKVRVAEMELDKRKFYLGKLLATDVRWAALDGSLPDVVWETIWEIAAAKKKDRIVSRPRKIDVARKVVEWMRRDTRQDTFCHGEMETRKVMDKFAMELISCGLLRAKSRRVPWKDCTKVVGDICKLVGYGFRKKGDHYFITRK